MARNRAEEEEDLALKELPQKRIPSDTLRRPYGLCAQAGIDTSGMRPGEAWASWNAYRKEEREKRKTDKKKKRKLKTEKEKNSRVEKPLMVAIGANKTANTPIYSHVPNGWKVTQGATTSPVGYRWIDNNKSRFGGERQTALVPAEIADAVEKRRLIEMKNAPLSETKREEASDLKKSAVVIPELNRRDIDMANSNSQFDRGDHSEHDYKLYANRVMSWDIADSKKQQIINELHRRWSKKLSYEAQHVPVTVAGPANYNAKRLNKSEQILQSAHDFTEWFSRVEENVKDSKRQYEDRSKEKARRAEENFSLWLSRGWYANPTAIANGLTPIAVHDPQRFVDLYEQYDKKYHFRKSTTAAKMYDSIKAGTFKGAPKAEKLHETSNLNTYKKQIAAGERVFLKFTTRPKPQVVYALKRRGWHWNALEGAWSVPVDKYDADFVDSIDDRYAKYL